MCRMWESVFTVDSDKSMCTKKLEGFLPIMTMRTITHITPRIIIICSQWIFRKSLEKQSNLTTTTVFVICNVLKAQESHQKFPFPIRIVSHAFFFSFVCKQGLLRLPLYTQVFALQVSTSACPHLGILPPVFILQFCSAGLKLRGSSLQGVSPIVQFWQLLITLQDLIHVYTHDIHHLEKDTQSNVVKSATKIQRLCVTDRQDGAGPG